MPLRSLDLLRTLNTVAQSPSLSAAAADLSLTKGAVSYQIKKLEQELGFRVFIRAGGKLALTDQGRMLWHASQSAIQQLDREISTIQKSRFQITIGMSTYFASRWLSQRLMRFTNNHPETSLRIQPVAGTIDVNQDGVDMAVRWGFGQWRDCRTELLFPCPAFATGNPDLASRVSRLGLEATLEHTTLLHDLEDSQSWQHWFKQAGLVYREVDRHIVIPDPNVRVQAVMDGQGIALNDRLVQNELQSGMLQMICDVKLQNYGYYLAYPSPVTENPHLQAFKQWLFEEVARDGN